MRFGKCKDCKKYKYLKSNGKCPTCIDNRWAVVHATYHAYTYTRIIEDGLSKNEAKQMARDHRKYIAIEESDIK